MKIPFLILFTLLAIGATAQEKPTPLTIGVTTKIKSQLLQEERVINIYLPEGYKANDTVKYAVVYVPDGGIAEDFLHIAGLVQYSSQPWVHRLPPTIVVGIENTKRQRDFTFPVKNLDFLKKTGYRKADIPLYGGSGAYIGFLERELMPYIDSHFKTSGHNTVVGESLAGLLVTELLVRQRGLFDDYVIISPSLWWGNEELIAEVSRARQSDAKHPVRVYIGAPRKSEDTLMYNDALRLKASLQKNGDHGTKLYFDYLPKETHATVIHQAVYDAFRWFGGKE